MYYVKSWKTVHPSVCLSVTLLTHQTLSIDLICDHNAVGMYQLSDWPSDWWQFSPYRSNQPKTLWELIIWVPLFAAIKNHLANHKILESFTIITYATKWYIVRNHTSAHSSSDTDVKIFLPKLVAVKLQRIKNCTTCRISWDMLSQPSLQLIFILSNSDKSLWEHVLEFCSA